MLAGCDSGGSKQASQSQRLSGTWEVLELLSAGGFRVFPDARLVVAEGQGRKKFCLIREDQSGTTEVTGSLEVVENNRLTMTGEFFPGTLFWAVDFTKPDDISGSVRLTLIGFTQRESIRSFLRFLEADETAQNVQMDLVLAS
jgi:hypothetical protein